ncbi:MAG: YfhO family protein [Anaerolineae bacterium]|nr:YfhO family protein [Anaerolineae bacterium]
MTNRSVPGWLPLALLGVMLGALFYPLLLEGKTLFWGLPSLQFYPWREFAFSELAEGRLPSWNPYTGAGSPLLANYQTAVFYPPNWLHMLLPDALAMSVIALLHLAWAGAGMWLFTGALGLPVLGRGISTLSYALSGYVIGRVGSFPTADTVAWIPWLFWLVHRVITGRRWRDVGWLALVMGLQLLAGHAQTVWYALVGVGLYAVWATMWGQRSASGRQRGMALLLAGLGIGLGVGIAAVQLLPTAEYLAESHRASGLDYKTTANLSYNPFRLVTLLSPNFYGTPADGSYLTNGIFFEDAAYIGFIPLISAAAAVVGWMRKRRALDEYPTFRSVPLWLALALLALIIATGRHGPVFRLLYDYVPTFDAFREPVRWLVLVVFSLSVLAGIGVQHWGRGKWVVFWSRLAAAGGGGIVVMALVIPQMVDVDAETLDVLADGMIVLGCWIAGAALLTLTQPVEGLKPVGKSRVLWSAAVLVFVACDLAWAGGGLNPMIPGDYYDPRAITPPDGRIYWFEDVQDKVLYDQFFDLSDYRVAKDNRDAVRASLLPNLTMLDHILTFNNFDPLLPRYHGQYVDLIEDMGGESSALLRAAGVTQVFADAPPDGWQGDTAPYHAPYDAAHNAPAPLAWLVDSAEWFDSDDAISDALRDPAWDPAHTVLLAGDPPDAPIPTAPAGGSVTVLPHDPDELRFRVDAENAAYLVISSTWYPGWEASINERNTDLYRANLAFLAVIISPGESTVTLRYRVNHEMAGVGGSLIALLVALGLVTLGSRKRGSANDQEQQQHDPQRAV